MLFTVHYGDDGGYMEAPIGAIAVVSADSFEEAAEKLGITLVPGTRRVIPNDSLREKIRSELSGDPMCEEVMENLVLVQK